MGGEGGAVAVAVEVAPPRVTCRVDSAPPLCLPTHIYADMRTHSYLNLMSHCGGGGVG